MRYTRLGTTGLEVSVIAVGCMSFGEPTRGGHPWSLSEDDSRPLIRQAVESGINFFDTANVYSDGSSEEIVGRALKDFAGPRDHWVLATKVFQRMHDGPNGAGLSRKAIMGEIDASLRRLDVDYVDLYQIHRWDSHTPIEETLEALHDVVKAGKARYIGASSMFAWQLSKALYTSRINGWSRFVSMQNHYSLLMREDEREMHPLCIDQGIGTLPWSPLARGRLTRPLSAAATSRSEQDAFGARLFRDEADAPVVDAVTKLAADRGVTPAQVALAWVLRNPVVTAPIVGATKAQHLTDATAAVDIRLSDEEAALLESHYRPHPWPGF